MPTPDRPDWIATYLAHTEGHPTPEIFRQWVAISCLAASMERRCFVDTMQRALFPNLYVLLVAPPGIGKNVALAPMEQLIRAANAGTKPTERITIAARSVNRASIIDNMCAGYKFIPVTGTSSVVEYHSIYAVNSELSILLPEFNLDYLGVLNDLYGELPSYSERRRGHSRTDELEVLLPQLNLLAGTQPAFMSEVLNDNSWKMGMASRLMMVYAGEGPEVDLFLDLTQDSDDAGTVSPVKHEIPNTPEFRYLVAGLKRIVSMIGRFNWDAEAKVLLHNWQKQKCPPIPVHDKLQAYLTRRPAHAIKLIMVSAISRSLELRITALDVQRGINWLLEIENLMPNIFKAMTARSDSQVINELYQFAMRIWAPKQKTIPNSLIFEFLQDRTTVEKIPRIIEYMEKSGLLERVAGSPPLWRPRARDKTLGQ